MLSPLGAELRSDQGAAHGLVLIQADDAHVALSVLRVLLADLVPNNRAFHFDLIRSHHSERRLRHCLGDVFPSFSAAGAIVGADLDALRQAAARKTRRVVVVDSLATLWLRHGRGPVALALAGLVADGDLVLAAAPAPDAALQSICSSHLRFAADGACAVTLRRRAGHARLARGQYAVRPDGSLAIRAANTKGGGGDSNDVDGDAVGQLPAAVFNLSLTEEQRQARAQVVLPHHRVAASEEGRPVARFTAEDDDDDDEEYHSDPDSDLQF